MTQEQFVKCDSHAHITSDSMYAACEEVIARAKKQGIKYIVNINTDQSTLERGLTLAEKYPKAVYNALATTPHDVEKEGEKNFEFFSEIIRQKKVVAVGETGLDYFYEHSNRTCQIDFLHRYLDLAEETMLPVIFHCRGDEAFRDLFAEVKQKSAFSAVLHCFTGTWEQARQVLDLGWQISISGIVTFKKSGELRETLKKIPLDRLFIETDSPYLAPQSRRGKLNEPAFIGEVAETIAEVKGVTTEEVCEMTYKNASTFFQIE